MDAKINLIPIQDKIIVKVIETEDKIVGGLYIPDNTKEKTQKAEVIALGIGQRENGELLPFEVKIGDEILIPRHTGFEFSFENKKYLILREEDILAIIK